MARGVRNTAGINHTEMQQKHSFRGLDSPQAVQGAKADDTTKAIEFLRLFMGEGQHTIAAIKAEAEKQEIPLETLLAAKNYLRVQKIPPEQEGGETLYQLPPEERPASLIEHTKPGEDRFSITDAEFKAWGFDTNVYEPRWVRDPRVWEDGSVRGPGATGHMREVLAQNPGSELVADENGEWVMNGTDLILLKVPRSQIDLARARDAQREKEYWAQIDEEQMADDEFPEGDIKRLKDLKRRNSIENHNAGMIGPASPSQGLNYEDYVKWRNLSPSDIEKEELSYSLGARASRELSGQAAEDVIRAQREQRRDASSGKFISIPPNVRPRNIQGARK